MKGFIPFAKSSLRASCNLFTPSPHPPTSSSLSFPITTSSSTSIVLTRRPSIRAALSPKECVCEVTYITRDECGTSGLRVVQRVRAQTTAVSAESEAVVYQRKNVHPRVSFPRALIMSGTIIQVVTMKWKYLNDTSAYFADIPERAFQTKHTSRPIHDDRLEFSASWACEPLLKLVILISHRLEDWQLSE